VGILSQADWPEVRAQINVGLTAAQLPDDTIEMDAFVGRAEREVVATDPQAPSRTGAEAAAVRLASIYLTAALLVPAVPNIVRQQWPDISYQMENLSIADKVADLRHQAALQLESYLEAGTEPVPRIPTIFTSARSCRTERYRSGVWPT
jgi:hypothetical protein